MKVLELKGLASRRTVVGKLYMHLAQLANFVFSTILRKWLLFTYYECIN